MVAVDAWRSAATFASTTAPPHHPPTATGARAAQPPAWMAAAAAAAAVVTVSPADATASATVHDGAAVSVAMAPTLRAESAKASPSSTVASAPPIALASDDVVWVVREELGPIQGQTEAMRRQRYDTPLVEIERSRGKTFSHDTFKTGHALFPLIELYRASSSTSLSLSPTPG